MTSTFFTQKVNDTSPATELAMKEMLLGLMRSKDHNLSDILHASDFRTAVEQLGMPMGHSIVEDVLLHCKVSAEDGSIDFSDLQSELAVQRKKLNEESARLKREMQISKQSSSGTLNGNNPFQKREEQDNRIKKEKFTLLLNKYRNEINEIFRDYSNHRLLPKDVLLQLNSYGICSNPRFKLMIEDYRLSDDLSFRDFFTALASYDPAEADGLATASHAAGKCMNTQDRFSLNAHDQSNSEQLFDRQIKRTNNAVKVLQEERNNNARAQLGRRREKLFEDLNPSGDAALYKNSSRIEEALKPMSNDSSMMLTHNRAQMIQGAFGEAPVIKYNVEIKLTREQVMAALRRLDSNTITLTEFEKKMYEIGVEMDPGLLKRIQDSLKTGKLDWKALVAEIDTQVFHKKALESRPNPEEIDAIKVEVGKCLHDKGGFSGLNTLFSIFNRMDENGDGMLSYNEFLKACSMFGLSEDITSDDLRLLFHELDINGDGSLDIREFTVGLRGEIRGSRLYSLRNAYNKIDVLNTNDVPLDDMVRSMQLQYHPDVISGLRNLRQAQTDFIHFVSSCTADEKNASMHVTFDAFINYWGNISFFIDDDKEFDALLKQIMGLGNLAPAPAIVLARRTAEGKGPEPASRAVQIHGNIVAWGQEPSSMEQSSRSTQRLYRRSAPEVDSPGKATLNIFNMGSRVKGKPLNDSRESSQEASSSTGNARFRAFSAHNESSNIFTWDTSKKGAHKARERSREQWERKMASVSGSVVDDEPDRTLTARVDLEDGERMAGMPSMLGLKKDVISKRGSNSSAARNHFGGPSPFATDFNNEVKDNVSTAKPNQNISGGKVEVTRSTPRPLSAIIKEKKSSNGPKSLQEVLSAKSNQQ